MRASAQCNVQQFSVFYVCFSCVLSINGNKCVCVFDGWGGFNEYDARPANNRRKWQRNGWKEQKTETKNKIVATPAATTTTTKQVREKKTITYWLWRMINRKWIGKDFAYTKICLELYDNFVADLLLVAVASAHLPFAFAWRECGVCSVVLWTPNAALHLHLTYPELLLFRLLLPYTLWLFW